MAPAPIIPAPIIIAIDGPAAAGKGTLARRLATALELPYLDTGLLYRAVARLVLDRGAAPDDAVTALAAAQTLRPADLERADLRGPPVDAAASIVAAFPEVRAELLDFQRKFAGQAGAVLDGRDIGTVIFPDAAVKLFITASPAARARRRWLEMRARGSEVALDSVAADMAQRDAQDSQRAAAPLRPAADAILVDTSELDAETTFWHTLGIVKSRLARD
jgi:cytidylate kinase